jgi:predicted O-methyltransferase YrrM
MATPFVTKVKLKIERIKREWRETPEEREWRKTWAPFDSIEGWLFPAEAKWLFDTARSLRKDASLAEIGSFKGRSTCCLALGCRGTSKRVFAIDTFDGGPDLEPCESFPVFRQNLERAQLLEYVQPVQGISWEVAKTWTTPLDFLFIDGSHIYEHVMADFTSFFPHVVPGGIIAFHDVHTNHPGVLRAWNETFRNELTDIGSCESIGFGKKPER